MAKSFSTNSIPTVRDHLPSWLPNTEVLIRRCQSLAMLDAIISPEWESRYYSFNSKWDTEEMMASMHNGQGDDYFILFNTAGAIIKGFDHESPMSPFANEPQQIWSGILDEVPSVFDGFLKEPAFSLEHTTFCLWHLKDEPSWKIGSISYPDDSDPDGSSYLLSGLDGKPRTYKKFAEEYYEQEITLASIDHIYQHRTLTDEIIYALNPENSLENLKSDIEEIGYQ